MKPELEPVIAKARAERRRFRRVRVDQPGKLFMPASSQEGDCTILDMSPGGAAIQSALPLEENMQVIIYIDGFGRFEGQITGRNDEGFGVQFQCTAAKRERIAEQLTLFAKGRSRAAMTKASVCSFNAPPPSANVSPNN